MLLPYMLNLGMLGGAVAPPATATNFPDPFSGSASVKGANPFAAAVVARVDPMAGTVTYRQTSS